MNQADIVIAKAKSFIGIKESPPNSNNVIFNTTYYGRPVSGAAYPWCMTYVWHIFTACNLASLFYGGKRTASCTVLMDWARKQKRFVTSGYKPGDVLIYNWAGNKNVGDHTGIVRAVDTRGQLYVVEGNTAIGNDSNGGQVMERIRPQSVVNIGAYRPPYKDIESEGNKAVEERYKTAADVPDWGRPTVLRLIAAKALAVGSDNVIDVSRDMVRTWVVMERWLGKKV